MRSQDFGTLEINVTGIQNHAVIAPRAFNADPVGDDVGEHALRLTRERIAISRTRRCLDTDDRARR
jgi:hypothetical protein